MKAYRDFRIWQKSVDLVQYTYVITAAMPKSEKFGLISQIRRCSVSIPSNIAEGYGRRSKKEFARFLHISMGSLYEYQTQIEIAYKLNYTSETSFIALFEKSREIERMISALINKLKQV